MGGSVRPATLVTAPGRFEAGKRARPALAGFAGATLLVSMAVAPVVAGAGLPRDALWAVVRICMAVDERVGMSFPCERIRAGPHGFAVLRAPGSRTHVIVTPTVQLSGLESSAVLSSGAPYWRAALDARALVAAEAGHRRPGDIALSVNARRSRSQDQFHIHVACANPRLLARLRAGAATIRSRWTRLPDRIEGAIYWARRIARDDPLAANALASLRTLPKQFDPVAIVLGAIDLSENGDGDVVYLVSNEPGSAAEDLLDLPCKTAPADQ